VSAGGIASGITIVNGGEVQVYGSVSGVSGVLEGFVDVASGGSATNTTLSFLAQLEVDAGGTASNVTLTGNFAVLNINSGAVAGTIDIATGVLADIAIAGSAMPTAVISGFDGADEIDLGDIAYDPKGSVVYSGGTLTVTEGGQAYALNVASSADYASGSFFMGTDGGSGTAIEFVGASSLIVLSGQTSSSIAVPGGAFLQVQNGGTSVAATLSGAGPFITYQPAPGDGGTLLVNSSLLALALEDNIGIASGTQVGFGGNLINAGQSVAATVTSGGLLFTESGTVQGAVIATSGIELDAGFLPGAVVVSGSVINGGLDGVAGYAVTAGVVVNSGGEQVVAGHVMIGGQLAALPGGTASATTVNAGGQQFVNDKGVGFATQINAGGEMVVNSAGTADAPVIGGSGTLVLNGGAIADSSVVFAGGSAVLDIGGASMPAATISGFAATDTIDLVNVSFSSSGSIGLAANNVLQVIENGATLDIQLDLAATYTGALFQLASDSGTGTDITVACYRAGTRIRTDRGEVPIEALRVGDRAASAFGGTAAVTWLGYRQVDCHRHPRPRDVWPVRVAAGAFGIGLPYRDLWLSPDHAVFVDGVLIPIRYLINDATIAQEPVDKVAYWHVELPAHDVLFAEGLAAESYLDTGNRSAFSNGGGTMLHPDFALRVWETESCAPLVLAGAELVAARSVLLERAEALGHSLTRDAGLHIVANGRVVRPAVTGRRHRFGLAGRAHEVRLVSRSAVPAAMHADSDDHRRLGVAVSRIVLDGRTVPVADARLGAGWHAVEPDGAGGGWRWTDGDAAFDMAGARRLEVEVTMAERYWLTLGAARARWPRLPPVALPKAAGSG
jgi:autotransporter passenger strand-loop-strand repeat protein